MKIQSPWMGRVKGSAGNMTGSKVYDKNVLRAKAFEVSNPNTAAQQTERSFFAQVADCCASVSEEQLRSLFGVKPKRMSRRNALTKQLSSAFTIDGNEKVLDFSKLPAIGNGEKLKVEIKHTTSSEDPIIWDLDANNQGLVEMPPDANIILVIFNNTTKQILLKNLPTERSTFEFDIDMSGEQPEGDCYIYATYASSGKNVYHRGFGSFIIKTRAEK